MLRPCLVALTLLVTAVSGAWALPPAAPAHAVPLVLTEGQTELALDGKVQGSQSIDYLLPAKKGQTLDLSFRPTISSIKLQLLAPEAHSPMFVGTLLHTDFNAPLSASGVYTLRVSMDAAAAKRGELGSYRLELELTDDAPPAAAPPASSR